MAKGDKLTDKQESYVQWLIKGKSQREAYRLAGYKVDKMADETIDVRACELFKKSKVRVRHDELKGKIIAKAEDETIITALEVLKEYKRIATFDPRKLYHSDGSPIPIKELDDDTAAAVAGLDIQETFKDGIFVGYTKKYKVANKIGALDSIARHLGMFVDRVDHTIHHSFEDQLKDIIED